jgi:hypothetical protein
VTQRKAGYSLISVTVASVIFFMGLLMFARSAASSRAESRDPMTRLLAETYASELLEYFRSLSTAQMSVYLSTNPYTKLGTIRDRYPLCSYVNLLDRRHPPHANILNRDPLAVLPPTPLDAGDGELAANRYYQVRIINVRTNMIRTDVCGAIPPYEFDFENRPNERYLVTVGVTWMAENKQWPKHIALSTILMD